jgi:hypothetical protein
MADKDTRFDPNDILLPNVGDHYYEDSEAADDPLKKMRPVYVEGWVSIWGLPVKARKLIGWEAEGKH